MWQGSQQIGEAPTIRVNGGGWSRPGGEIAWLRGSSADGTVFPGPVAINATNGQQLSVYPDPFYGVDGSVHFIDQSINIRTFAALVTRASGEIINGVDF